MKFKANPLICDSDQIQVGNDWKLLSSGWPFPKTVEVMSGWFPWRLVGVSQNASPRFHQSWQITRISGQQAGGGA